MSRKLFLTSTGFNPEINVHFSNLNLKNLDDTIVAFIPTAVDPYEDKHLIEYDRNVIKLMGMHIREIDLKLEDEESMKLKFTSCDVIYVCGGNTYYLLDWVRKSGFDKVLPGMLDNGKIYVGVSAGSIIVGPDIEPAGWEPQPDENIAGLLDTTGIGLVSFGISPHFEEKYKTVLEEKSKGINYPLIAISDQQALVCIDKEYKIVGNGAQTVFNQKTVVIQ